METQNHNVVWCPLYRLNLVQLCDMLLVIFKNPMRWRYWISNFKFLILLLIIKKISSQKVGGPGPTWPPCALTGLWYWILRLQNAYPAQIPHFLSVESWIFCSVFCHHLIQIQKVIPLTLWNSMNLWPTL